MLVSLGDVFDRGRQPYQVYRYLKKLKQNNKAILIKGNHEDLMLEAISRGYFLYRDNVNGTIKTACDLVKLINPALEVTEEDICKCLSESDIVDFLDDMIDYYETNNYIFTHGFIPVIKQYNYKIYMNDWRNFPEEFKMARWENGLENSIKFNIKEKGKTIVVGHIHASYGNVRKQYKELDEYEYKYLESENLDYYKPYFGDGVIGLDACTVRSGFINCLVIED